MKHLLLGISLVATMNVAQAQEFENGIEYYGRVVDFNTDKKLVGVKIIIKQDGKVFETITTASNGKFVARAPFGYVYQIHFEYPGYVGKFVEVDGTTINADEEVDDLPMQLDVTLFEEVPNVDFSLLRNSPIGRAAVDAETGEMDWNIDYTIQMKDRINELIEKADKVKREQEKKVNDLIKEGDKLVVAKNFDQAINKYNTALSFQPNNEELKLKITQVKEEREAHKENSLKQSAFKNIIATADKSFDAKNYDQAEKSYQEALALIPNDQYAKNQLAKLSALNKKAAISEQNYKNALAKGNKAKSTKHWKSAIEAFIEALEVKPQDVFAQQELTNAEKELALQVADNEKTKQYTALIKKADDQLKLNDFDAAKASYQAALEVKKTEKYPADQLILINNRIKEIEAARAQKEANELAAKKKTQGEYDQLINDADQFFEKGTFAQARQKYKEASLLFPSEIYPKEQQIKIKKKLEALEAESKLLNAEKAKRSRYDKLIIGGDKAFQNKDLSQAKEFYSSASKLYADEVYPKNQLLKISEAQKLAEEDKNNRKQYTALINKANVQFNASDYDAALESYKTALAQYPTEKYPKSQIKRINTLQEVEEQKKVRQAMEESKDKAMAQKYLNLIEEADLAFAKEDYDQAKTVYKEAFSTKQEKYPQDQIDKINALLKKQTQRLEVKKQYDKIIAVADKKFNSGDYTKAINLYKRATSLFPKDEYPRDQVDKAMKQMIDKQAHEAAQKELNNRYNKIVKTADIAFVNQQFESALTSYKEALSVKPNESHPQDRIDAIIKQQERLKAKKEEKRLKESTGDELTDDLLSIAKKSSDIGDHKASDSKYWGKKVTNLSYQEALTKLNTDQNKSYGAKIKTVSDSEQDRIELIRKRNKQQVDNQDKVGRQQVNYQDKQIVEKGEKGRSETNLSSFNSSKEGYENDVSKRNRRISEGSQDNYSKTEKVREINYLESKNRADRSIQNLEDLNKQTSNYIEFNNKKSSQVQDVNNSNYNKVLAIKNVAHSKRKKEIDQTIANSDELLAIKDEKFTRSFKKIKDENNQVSNSVLELERSNNEIRVRKHVQASKQKYSNENFEAIKNGNNSMSFEARQKEVNRSLSAKEELENKVNSAYERSKRLKNRQRNQFEELSKIKEDNHTLEFDKNEKRTKQRIDVREQLVKSNDKGIVKFETSVKNGLALKYKQGVTTETFEKKDQFGNVKIITIRKIVVEGDKGNEYVMTATRTGKSFMKNGSPISELLWDAETYDR